MITLLIIILCVILICVCCSFGVNMYFNVEQFSVSNAVNNTLYNIGLKNKTYIRPYTPPLNNSPYYKNALYLDANNNIIFNNYIVGRSSGGYAVYLGLHPKTNKHHGMYINKGGEVYYSPALLDQITKKNEWINMGVADNNTLFPIHHQHFENIDRDNTKYAKITPPVTVLDSIKNGYNIYVNGIPSGFTSGTLYYICGIILYQNSDHTLFASTNGITKMPFDKISAGRTVASTSDNIVVIQYKNKSPISYYIGNECAIKGECTINNGTLNCKVPPQYCSISDNKYICHLVTYKHPLHADLFYQKDNTTGCVITSGRNGHLCYDQFGVNPRDIKDTTWKPEILTNNVCYLDGASNVKCVGNDGVSHPPMILYDNLGKRITNVLLFIRTDYNVGIIIGKSESCTKSSNSTATSIDYNWGVFVDPCLDDTDSWIYIGTANKDYLPNLDGISYPTSIIYEKPEDKAIELQKFYDSLYNKCISNWFMVCRSERSTVDKRWQLAYQPIICPFDV